MKFLCDKCGNDRCVEIKGASGLNGSGNCIPLNPGFVLVTRKVCTRCGHVDEWISDHQSIEKLIKKYGIKGE